MQTVGYSAQKKAKNLEGDAKQSHCRHRMTGVASANGGLSMEPDSLAGEIAKGIVENPEQHRHIPARRKTPDQSWKAR